MIITLSIISVVLIITASIFAFNFYNKLSLLRVNYDNYKKETEHSFSNKDRMYHALEIDYKTLEERRIEDLSKSDEDHESQLLELERLFEIKIKEFQGNVNEYETYFKYYEKYFDSFIEIIKICDARIKQIDAKGTFKSDDEIGFFFENIKEIQATLNEFNVSRPGFKNDPKIIKTVDGFEIPKGPNYIPAEQVDKILNK